MPTWIFQQSSQEDTKKSGPKKRDFKKKQPKEWKNNLKNGLLNMKHQETKMLQNFNQLILPKGLQQQVMSVNHDSAFSGHPRAKKTEVKCSRTSSGQDYARTSLGFAFIIAFYVLCAREQSRGVV